MHTGILTLFSMFNFVSSWKMYCNHVNILIDMILKLSEEILHLYIHLRRSHDCLWVGMCVDSLEVCVKSATHFIYLFWGSVTLST